MATKEIMQFKTNINCSGCIKAVTPWLNQAEGIEHWEVDTDDADKTLTVKATGVTKDKIRELVQKAGFEITER